ncbi:hypothetical protein CAOG_009530 [Capsaspora owczarzaki ATCC 30864]|uniref:NOD3 protein n=1 Tax=Capsaspora owczarzaki (strain ATCC 30864) TaxID=595528 RepID=A0A0D2VM13_CAPO3|nr:hypothetical protein CAOG_009530 [Capsaspora owczarzaki ATCC 30864]
MSERQRELFDKVENACKALDMDCSQIGEDEAWAIAEALKVNRTLNDLNLRENQLGDAGARAIAETLKVNTTLNWLHLGQNQIGDAGARAIAETLKVNMSLTYLNLYDNQIGDAGAQAIAEALKVNTTLTELSLTKDDGARAIAEALKANKRLSKLRLNYNQIGDGGASAIAEALKVNRTLTEIYLPQNYLTEVGVSALRRSGNTTCKLKELDSQRTVSRAQEYTEFQTSLNSQRTAVRARKYTESQTSVTLPTETLRFRSELAAKNLELAAKDQMLATKDQMLAAKEQMLAAKDQMIAAKEQELAAKEQELQQLRSDLAVEGPIQAPVSTAITALTVDSSAPSTTSPRFLGPVSSAPAASGMVALPETRTISPPATLAVSVPLYKREEIARRVEGGIFVTRTLPQGTPLTIPSASAVTVNEVRGFAPHLFEILEFLTKLAVQLSNGAHFGSNGRRSNGRTATRTLVGARGIGKSETCMGFINGRVFFQSTSTTLVPRIQIMR